MSIVITHDGVDISGDVLFDSLDVVPNRGERVDVASFQIQKDPGDTVTPVLDKVVTVVVNGITEFAGRVQKITETMLGHNSILYTVDCVDYTTDLDRNLVTERFENMSVNDIIDALMTTYTTGFTWVHVDAPQIVASVAFNRIYLSQCLKKLADSYNFVWYVDYDKDLHFFGREAEPAPITLTDASDNYIIESLKITRDLSQLRNKILVEGGEVESDTTRSVFYAGNGVQHTFDTQYKYAEKPTVTVGGVAKTVGAENVEDELSFQCMWSYQQKYVRFTTGNIPPVPGGVTNVEINGIPLFPIIVSVPSPASIAQYGVREFSVKDRTIKTQAQAIERAIAEILAWGQNLNEGSFSTYVQGLRPGQIITINSTARAVNEDFIIQSVRMVPISRGATYPARWDVTLVTLKSVGIIEILQKLLLDEALEINEQETLLTFLQFTDTLTITDSIGTPTTTVGPYEYGTAVVGFSTW